jgi:tetratricopeptide (TPR) repeat protein
MTSRLAPLVAAACLAPGMLHGQDPKPAKPGSLIEVEKPGDRLADAKKLARSEDWEPAATAFLAFLREHADDPQAGEARFWAGYCLVKEGDNDRAIEALKPFEEALAGDNWADDALVQIGEAHQSREEWIQARDSWNRLLEKHPDSVWRQDVLAKLAELQFHRMNDVQACLDACRKVVEDTRDRDATSEARYLGAYCLNALKRFDEAAAWMDRHFNPENPVEEAWRIVLDVQKRLVVGKEASLPPTVEALDRDFPDLGRGDRLDVLNKLMIVLARSQRGQDARALVLAELKRGAGLSDDEVGTLLDRFRETYADSHDPEFATGLGGIADDAALAPLVRLASRLRQAQTLREQERSSQAEEVLRKALAAGSTDLARARLSLQLSELLADDQSDPAAALKLLNELVPDVKRRDLVFEIKARIKELEEQRDEDRDDDDEGDDASRDDAA